jgi:hypothetical protein
LTHTQCPFTKRARQYFRQPDILHAIAANLALFPRQQVTVISTDYLIAIRKNFSAPIMALKD